MSSKVFGMYPSGSLEGVFGSTIIGGWLVVGLRLVTVFWSGLGGFGVSGVFELV
jgi:hypothetical protein